MWVLKNSGKSLVIVSHDLDMISKRFVLEE